MLLTKAIASPENTGYHSYDSLVTNFLTLNEHEKSEVFAIINTTDQKKKSNSAFLSWITSTLKITNKDKIHHVVGFYNGVKPEDQEKFQRVFADTQPDNVKDFFQIDGSSQNRPN